MSWEQIRIGDLCKVKSGKRLPKGMSVQDEPTNRKYLRVTDLKSQTVDESDIKYITEDVFTLISRYTISCNDIYLSIAGTIGKVGIIPNSIDGISLTENCCKLTELSLSNINQLFLMYYLRGDEGQSKLQSKTGGASQPKLAITRLKDVLIPVPSIQTQKRIADILSAYDDLIENNLQRIKLLEQAAQNIYKEWFVNLRFPGHENAVINEDTGLPVGWKNLNFIDVAKFTQGLQVDTNKQYNFKKEGQKKFIRIVDVTQGGQEPRYVDCTNSKYEVERDDLFMIRYGSPKVVMGYAGVIANNFFKIKILKEVNMNNNYLYAFLNRDEITKKLMNYSSSATMPAISFKRIANMQILCPDFETQEKYSKLMDANWSLFFTLNEQNQKLKAARDILLPRLMNRTIEV
jgi:type I restriction enzyme S subunit